MVAPPYCFRQIFLCPRVRLSLQAAISNTIILRLVKLPKLLWDVPAGVAGVLTGSHVWSPYSSWKMILIWFLLQRYRSSFHRNLMVDVMQTMRNYAIAQKIQPLWKPQGRWTFCSTCYDRYSKRGSCKVAYHDDSTNCSYEDQCVCKKLVSCSWSYSRRNMANY